MISSRRVVSNDATLVNLLLRNCVLDVNLTLTRIGLNCSDSSLIHLILFVQQFTLVRVEYLRNLFDNVFVQL